MSKEEKLERFTERLVADEDVLAIIIFGSKARGNSRPESDIDLVVILKDGYKRAVEYLDDQAFEIIYTTERKALEYWQSNKHDAIGLWNIAKVLFDRDGTGKRLEEFGSQLCKEIPPEVSASMLEHFRFDFQDSQRAIKEIMGDDPATASLLLHKKISDLINLYFDLKRIWRPAPKQLLGQIRAQNAELGKMLEDFYTAEKLSHRIVTAEKVGIQILDQRQQ